MLALAKQLQDAVRVAEVLQVLVRHGFADLVQWAGLHEGLPARLLRKVRLLETPSGRAAAERDYRRKLGEEEDNLVALQGLAQVLWVRGEKAESVALLEKAVAVKPDHAGLRYNLGSSLLQTGRLDAAETHLRKTLALGEYEGRACKALGVIAQKRGDTDRALGYLRRALRCNPGDWQAHWNLSVVYEQRHELGRAIGAAESVLRLRPGHAQARARVLRLKEKARERP